MPYPSQIDKSAIVGQARLMIETEGVEALSLAKLAGALGVKAPSLYRYVQNKAELLAEVSFLTFATLVESLEASGSAEQDENVADPMVKLLAVARDYRAFAHANPRTYVLAYTAQERGDEEKLVELVMPIQQIVAEVVPAEHLRTALRGFMALLHGFVMLEIHNQLRRGGDLGSDYEKSVRAYLSGWKN